MKLVILIVFEAGMYQKIVHYRIIFINDVKLIVFFKVIKIVLYQVSSYHMLHLQSKFALKVLNITYLSSEKVKGNLLFKHVVHSHFKFLPFFKSDISVGFNLLHFLCTGEQQLLKMTDLSILQFLLLHTLQSLGFLHWISALAFSFFLFFFFVWKRLLICYQKGCRMGKYS